MFNNEKLVCIVDEFKRDKNDELQFKRRHAFMTKKEAKKFIEKMGDNFRLAFHMNLDNYVNEMIKEQTNIHKLSIGELKKLSDFCISSNQMDSIIRFSSYFDLDNEDIDILLENYFNPINYIGQLIGDC